ncbi:acid-sensing ion channel 4-A-like [Tubulanus polymorphus]|uniref:acid-sensing ion channel 4-A-like n=1 Tax=Tubulanus polymorphus TaxID=672921 RepID=UPI003DA4DD2E
MADPWYSRMRRNAMEYAEGSNFHGLKFIFYASSTFARCMWLFVFLLATTGFVYQVQDRIGYYLGLPIRVNIEVEEASELKFPAVTICNTNSFVMSTAYWDGLFYNLTRYYTATRVVRSTMTELDSMNATEMALRLAHKKKDMIKYCFFRSTPCSYLNFTTRLTDYGVCYTFNGNSREQEMTTNTGSTDGLTLLLNVEQYQSMSGTHPSAGIKFLVHSPGDIPRVTELGLAVPASMNGVVGLKYSLIDNLQKPYGSCVDDSESQNNCMIRLSVSEAAATCRCRPGYATWLTEWPVCNLTASNNCLEQKMGGQWS